MLFVTSQRVLLWWAPQQALGPGSCRHWSLLWELCCRWWARRQQWQTPQRRLCWGPPWRPSWSPAFWTPSVCHSGGFLEDNQSAMKCWNKRRGQETDKISLNFYPSLVYSTVKIQFGLGALTPHSCMGSHCSHLSPRLSSCFRVEWRLERKTFSTCIKYHSIQMLYSSSYVNMQETEHEQGLSLTKGNPCDASATWTITTIFRTIQYSLY